MKRIITFIILAVVSANLCQAQYQWVKQVSPTNKNLQTAVIADNGDIYVFGDDAYGAKSTDNGETWEIITGIDDERSRKITTCGYCDGYLCVAGENGLQKKYVFSFFMGGTPGWYDNPVYLSGDIENISMNNSENVYFFPKFGGLGSKLQYMKYEIDGEEYSGGPNLYNLYLPFMDALSPRSEKFRYKSSTAGRGRIISFLHRTDIGTNGVLAYTFISDVHGFTWREINFSLPEICYINGISFKDDIGFITGSNMFGGGAYLCLSTDNGENWTLIGKADTYFDGSKTVSRSVYTDFDGNNYNGIVVGSNVTWNSDKRIYETNYGFVKVNNETLINLGPAGLNFITGNDDEVVIVGDGGNVFLGKRTDVSSDQSLITKNDLVIFQWNNDINIKSSKIINKINIFDVSGKLVARRLPKQVSETVEMNNFPTGIYLIQVDEKVKEIFIK
jgi:photosystem II stability/assembly factor-like uncharacterized protein